MRERPILIRTGEEQPATQKDKNKSIKSPQQTLLQRWTEGPIRHPPTITSLEKTQAGTQPEHSREDARKTGK